MGTLYLDVQIYGGSKIEDACRDAVALAQRLNITIWFKFNGIRCHAEPDSDPLQLARDQQVAQLSGATVV